mmetsp:Transcript_9134/g.16058  ORF Transcript_9134/g.16058 Transcript_9134/m.16058 type:complete len:81 (-) Transcript_9134:151-393(-)
MAERTRITASTSVFLELKVSAWSAVTQLMLDDHLLLSLFANAAQGNRWRQANGGNMRRALACSTTATNFDFTTRSVIFRF